MTLAIILWTFFAISALLLADYKNRSGWWWITGVLLGPFALLWLALLPKRPRPRDEEAEAERVHYGETTLSDEMADALRKHVEYQNTREALRKVEQRQEREKKRHPDTEAPA